MKEVYRKKDRTENRTTRRAFLHRAGFITALTVVPRYVLGGSGHTPPSEKINLGFVGCGGQGMILMKGFLQEPDVNILAVCDVEEAADYSKFDYKGMAGRGPARKLVEEYYAAADSSALKQCRTYTDFRKMLDEQKDIDAVVIATPDHWHALICISAIRAGKHVYCEKPLARTIYEVRQITQAAAQSNLATQMGNHGRSGEGPRLTCEWIADGAVGPVREVHAWTEFYSWTDGPERPKDTPPVPSTLNWDFWLGPAPQRPYHPAYHPHNWRAWWDFGTGALGDFACHHLDPALWALKLDHPTTVEAEFRGGGPEHVPSASKIHYHFDARGDMPPVELYWYDGGLEPERPPELEPQRMMGSRGNGIIIVGDKGKIMGGGWGESPRLIPEARMKAYKQPPKTIPRIPGGNHLRDWLRACKTGQPACSDFRIAGPVTEAILLGNVAIRSGQKLYWDPVNLKAGNARNAEQFIYPQYQHGWTL